MKTSILQPNSEDIQTAARALIEGQLVAIPTETVYGLAGNIHMESAILAIFNAKERPKFDPLIVHIPPLQGAVLEEALTDLVDFSALSDSKKNEIETLIQTFWPGPLTLVLPKNKKVSDLVTSGLNQVAIRMPAHPVAQKLLIEAQVPLAAPSANRFGRISPTSAEDVMEELKGRIPFILDGGPCQVGIESTILQLNTNLGRWNMLRPGGVPKENLERVLKQKIPSLRANLNTDLGRSPEIIAPGMLPAHYAPQKPLFLLEKDLQESSLTDLFIQAVLKELGNKPNSTYGFLCFEKPSQNELSRLFSTLPQTIRILSPGQRSDEAARRLFSSLRELDQSPCDFIVAESCPFEDGLGLAIQDRLLRASHSTSCDTP